MRRRSTEERGTPSVFFLGQKTGLELFQRGDDGSSGPAYLAHEEVCWQRPAGNRGLSQVNGDELRDPMPKKTSWKEEHGGREEHSDKEAHIAGIPGRAFEQIGVQGKKR